MVMLVLVVSVTVVVLAVEAMVMTSLVLGMVETVMWGIAWP